MNHLNMARKQRALRDWMFKCRNDINQENRYPDIDFDADTWGLSAFRAGTLDVHLSRLFKSFSHLDVSYSQAIRCMAAEFVISGDSKSIDERIRQLKILVLSGSPNLFDLRRDHLKQIEEALIERCKLKPQSAGSAITSLQSLARFLDRLERTGVIDPPSWNPAHETHKTLLNLLHQHRRRSNERKIPILDRQIEALSDAMNALFNGDNRLSSFDRAALAVTGVLMCAPSRINEPLSMALDDVVSVEDYGKWPENQKESDIGRMHALLLQKGSKGASWTAKPALTFMHGLLMQCMQVIKDNGKRSRMLAEWYEQNPNTLFLPPSLEAYRGKMITRSALWQIVNLVEVHPTGRQQSNVRPIWGELKAAGLIREVHQSTRGRKVATLQAVAWDDLELVLIRRVGEAMDKARRVTATNHYVGRLSNMLMLFDTQETPYLPGSIKYKNLRRRFRQTEADKKSGAMGSPTVFEKLNLTMVVNGKIEYAWIMLHDPRRWLTTQALAAPERLSDVLINKWANRLSIQQLKHYDLRTETQKADQASMPVVAELTDISLGLQKIEGIEAEYGLKTEIVVADEARVSLASMDSILSATEDRPVARTSSQIIILYPSRFGVCLHQHHETPCRSYSCGPCSENIVVKGHLPTNEALRKRDELLTRSVITQVEQLVTAHNREIADSPESLEAHLVTLVREGLTVQEISDELISKFHEVKDRVKSVRLRNELEEAFVARGMVQRLNDPDVASGALMRYHNPVRHASPGHERGLEAHGGRHQIETRLEQFHREHPQFAPTRLGLKDERDLLSPDDDDNDDG